MLSDIRINGSASEAVIDIEGVIGVPEQTQFLEPGGRVATYARFAEALAAVAAVQAPRVVVNIRSAGGDVNDALLIFDALQGLGAEVVTRCYGYVASAATVIAQAASPGCREISSNAFYLIHCSESAAEGNSRSLSAAKELLDRTDERIADIYASRSGRPVAGFAALMNENGGKGRWLTPGETVEAGLADTVIPSPVNCASGEMPDGCGDIGTLCRLFGLTPPPDVTGRERCSGLAERVVRRMGALSRLSGVSCRRRGRKRRTLLRQAKRMGRRLSPPVSPMSRPDRKDGCLRMPRCLPRGERGRRRRFLRLRKRWKTLLRRSTVPRRTRRRIARMP